MARILAISSYVASGHVGLAAIVPVLQAFGHEVIAVPTCVLSCHYGHAHVGGITLEPADFDAILTALEANGTFDGLDAIITGFLPAPGHIHRIADLIEKITSASSDTIYLCDPVMGDDPGGLYVPTETAAAIRDRLLPLAHILTPNRFELAWLSQHDVRDTDEAATACRELQPEATIFITSVPSGEHAIANVMSRFDEHARSVTPRLDDVPHGTGDLFSSFVAAAVVGFSGPLEALGAATASVRQLAELSAGSTEIRLAEFLNSAIVAEPAPVDVSSSHQPIETGSDGSQ